MIASGPAAIDAIHLVTDVVATQLPNMERMGITKASEVELPTLAQRILAEVGADGTLVGRAEVGAWATCLIARCMLLGAAIASFFARPRSRSVDPVFGRNAHTPAIVATAWRTGQIDAGSSLSG